MVQCVQPLPARVQLDRAAPRQPAPHSDRRAWWSDRTKPPAEGGRRRGARAGSSRYGAPPSRTHASHPAPARGASPRGPPAWGLDRSVPRPLPAEALLAPPPSAPCSAGSGAGSPGPPPRAAAPLAPAPGIHTGLGPASSSPTPSSAHPFADRRSTPGGCAAAARCAHASSPSGAGAVLGRAALRTRAAPHGTLGGRPPGAPQAGPPRGRAAAGGAPAAPPPSGTQRSSGSDSRP